MTACNSLLSSMHSNMHNNMHKSMNKSMHSNMSDGRSEWPRTKVEELRDRAEGADLRGSKTRGPEPRGSEPRGRSVGAEPTHTHKQTNEQTDQRQESERKVRAVECRSGQALEMLRARTAGQHRARQAKECQNNQAHRQASHIPPKHTSIDT